MNGFASNAFVIFLIEFHAELSILGGEMIIAILVNSIFSTIFEFCVSVQCVQR